MVEALLLRPILPLNNAETIAGAGVYAIYYTGNFPAYLPIAERNREDRFSQPIYVGKAVPEGTRKGTPAAERKKSALAGRLRIHARSLKAAKNSDVKDFWCRALPVDDVWIPLGESMMITELKPVWNVLVDGFGNNDPGKGRKDQVRSQWDVLHPGRSFATKLAKGRVTDEMVVERLADFFAGKHVPLLMPEDPFDEEGDTN